MNNVECYEETNDFDYILIKTKKVTVEERGSLYDATCAHWKASLERAQTYKYVLSVINQIVREVYEVEEWKVSTLIKDRIKFKGKIADESIRSLYVGKRIPEKYRIKGMASPFLYKKD